MAESFFNQINFSAANEDGQAELMALQLTERDNVFCISGSGARPLDLLTACPKRIYSIDFNITQNHLLNLKLAAYQHFDYQEFGEFVGLKQSIHRVDLFEKLKERLPNSSQQFWLSNLQKLEAGILYCGTWEKLLRLMSRTTFLRKRRVEQLWNAEDLEHQIELWDKHWDNRFLKTLIRAISVRFLWTSIIREPGARLIPRNFDIGAYIYQSIDQLAHHSLIRENPWANLLFRGRYTESCILPIHLRQEHFASIRQNISRIEIVTSSIDEFLHENPTKFDAWSLSDFASYAPIEAYKRIWQSVVDAAAPNSTFCERFFLVKRNRSPESQPAETWQRSIEANQELESKLSEIDHTCLYSFRAGKINPTQSSPFVNE